MRTGVRRVVAVVLLLAVFVAMGQRRPAVASPPVGWRAMGSTDSTDSIDRIRRSVVAGPPIATPASSLALLSAVEAASSVRPVRLEVPRLGIDIALVPEGINPASGELDVPPSNELAGWYAGASRPGEPGGAVVAGHVDHDGREGPFFRLRDASPGDVVIVEDTTGARRTFRATSLEYVPRSAIPAERLAGYGGPSRLSLVTCGGAFDRGARHYLENVILTAEPV